MLMRESYDVDDEDEGDNALLAAAAGVFVKWDPKWEKKPKETIAEIANAQKNKPTIFIWKTRDAGKGWSKESNDNE